MVKATRNGRKSDTIDKLIILSRQFDQKRFTFIEATFVTLKFKDTENSNGQMVGTILENL